MTRISVDVCSSRADYDFYVNDSAHNNNPTYNNDSTYNDNYKGSPYHHTWR